MGVFSLLSVIPLGLIIRIGQDYLASGKLQVVELREPLTIVREIVTVTTQLDSTYNPMSFSQASYRGVCPSHAAE